MSEPNPIKAAVDGAAPFDPTRPITDRRVVRFRRKAELDGDLDLGCARLAKNDTGNGERFVARHAADFFHVPSLNWHAWTGTHWSREEGERRAMVAAMETAVSIHLEAEAIRAAGPRPAKGKEGEEGYIAEEPAKAWMRRLAEHREWAVVSGNAARLKAMLEVAKNLRSREVEELDARPWLFNVANGTLELRPEPAGGIELRAHARGDLITHCAPVAYDPEARCPLFDAFLEKIQPDAAVRDFLMRLLGLALTGSTAEQIVVLFHGKGSNGKSTFCDVALHLLGDYGGVLPFESLLHDERRRGGEATPDLAELPGKRLVLASEPEQGARFSEARLKSLSGGERIAARPLREAMFDFLPQFKLWLSFNNKPTVRGQDDGIWRRLCLVPWPVSIPKEERDPDLAQKLRGEPALKTAGELPGILNRALAGLRDYFERGLCLPEAVTRATAEYRQDSDPIGAFVGVAVAEQRGSDVPAKRLYGAYTGWCKLNAAEPVSQTAFGRMLADRGFEKLRARTVTYKNIRLLDEFLGGQEQANDEGRYVGAADGPEP